MVKKYVKKPVIIEAIKWTTSNLFEVTKFISGIKPDTKGSISSDKWEDYKDSVEKDGLFINTLEGKMKVSKGDYIIKGIKGGFYPCKPDIFKSSYKLV